MFRNNYDNDITTFSPHGRLHQIEYALEAVKQGSACVGLKSSTCAVLVALQRRLGGDLASYQNKMLKIDEHMGIVFSGLTSDARVLSNFMQTECLRHKMIFSRPLSTKRAVTALADKAQVNTQVYGSRPYGVGFLVAGFDTQPHLYEVSPSGNAMDYLAQSIGARSQSARTYLESHLPFLDCQVDELVVHGLQALKQTLQTDKTLESCLVAVVDKNGFRILSTEEVQNYQSNLMQ